MRGLLTYLKKDQGFFTRLIIVAACVRILAAFFSEGYHMSDDHFLAIEPVGSWVMGENYHNWYPNDYNQVQHAQPFSYFYYFLNFVFLSFAKFLVGSNPFSQMLIVRLIHASIGIWGVAEMYKLVKKLAWNEVGKWMLWSWVFAGIVTVYEVHQMPEMVCIPFLLAGANFWLRNGTRDKAWSGVFFALAVGMRYQVIWIPLTLGVYALMKSQWKTSFIYGISFVSIFFLTQIDDVLLWNQGVFQHLFDYFHYNSTHLGQYPSNVFSYLSLITYYVLAPLAVLLARSLMLSKAWKDFSKYNALFLAVLIFIVFHLVIPNRQERFLLPAVPFLLLIAAAYLKPAQEKWIQYNWFLGVVFTLGALFFVPKRNQLEVCKLLLETGQMQNVIVDNYAGDGPVWLPMYYTGKMVHPFTMHGKRSIQDLKKQMEHELVYDCKRLPMPTPNYLVLWGEVDRENRKEAYVKAGFALKSIQNETKYEVLEIQSCDLNR